MRLFQGTEAARPQAHFWCIESTGDVSVGCKINVVLPC